MRRFFKFLIPILLAFVLIGSLAWYFLEYDPNFTQDLLLSQARYLQDKGNHASAVWFYNRAYHQSSQDEDVAIELSNQFKSIGNYTKAEYTLSHAIADGGTSKLYIALCQLYVEQDKLLDAVTMLENIGDPEIKAELDALRPATPLITPEPGFYTQYISLDIQASDGTLCANALGEYPSLSDPAWVNPLTLPAGETTVYALSVGDNGLVSKLGIYGYTIGGIVEKVEFSDPEFEKTLRAQLELDESTDIYTNALWEVESLSLSEAVTDYSDLSYFPYLKSLTIENGNGDLTPLENLTILEKLCMTDCRIPDDGLKIISSLQNLRSLTLSNCNLSTISGLNSLTNLELLDISHNTIRNLSPLTQMTNLTELYLQHNAVTDLTIVGNLKKLQVLDASYNAFTSAAPLISCTTLEWLSLSNNKITSTDGLSRLTSLSHLDLSDNNLSDISPIASCKKISELNVSNNTITDISALSSLNELTNFDFSQNQISALPQWDAGCKLISINGSYNLLDNIDILGTMGQLNNVYMDYNLITNIDVLANCPRLIQVDVYGNIIEDVSLLTDKSIIVRYTPIETITDSE